MRHLYLDIFSGLSGDMFLGALVDLGVEFKTLERELLRLGLTGYHLHCFRGQKSGIEGVKFDVHVEGESGTDGSTPEHSHAEGGTGQHHHPHPHPPHGQAHGPNRDHAAIRKLILASQLSDWVKQRSLAVFTRIAIAEGKIHGLPPEQVHFHEVGGIDSIVDIVGTCVGLEQLGCPEVSASPVIDGTGFVRCAHGMLPIPTAATLEILGARGFAVTQCAEPNELITPTGAALLAEFAVRTGPMQSVVGAQVGYGLGTRDNRTRPNLVRAILWDDGAVSAPTDWEVDEVAILETNLDDVSGEVLGHVLEKALRLGAWDVFHTPVQMKKNRPGVIFTIVCQTVDADRFCELLLTETSAFGVRRTVAERRKLRRSFTEVKTEYGVVKIKLGSLRGETVQAAPEFESVRSIASMAGVPCRWVLEAAITAYRAQR